MDKQPLFLNLSGIYQRQEFYRKAVMGGADVIQGMAFAGTDCYCDEQAVKLLEENMQKYRLEGIHYLDSGNYHYISYLWLKRIDVPFELIYFDNHPDMQHSLFGDILSCGGWVKTALTDCTNLIRVLCIGVDETLLTEEMQEDDRVTFVPKQQIGDGESGKTLCGRIDAWFRAGQGARLPVYISVDKDVLAEQEVKTNWEQGSMTKETLFAALSVIAEERKILGMDICGEPSGNETLLEKDLELSSQINQQFMHFINNL